METLNKQTTIGHVHLKVADLERSVSFYTNVLGFEISTRLGESAAFLSVGGYHHHIGLNTWESLGGTPANPNHTGLYHFAILVPDRRELAKVVQRLTEHNWPIEGAADHGVSEAIYLRDPDRNGIEIYRDRPRTEWPHDKQGALIMYTRPLDFDSLTAELK